VPADASPGSHFGGVFFESKPPQSGSTGAAIGARVGTVISLRIAGEIVEEILLREFSTERFLYDAPPVGFVTKIENRGNTLARPQGGIEITDMFGKKIAEIDVNLAGGAVPHPLHACEAAHCETPSCDGGKQRRYPGPAI
jgi:hypothetical protein